VNRGLDYGRLPSQHHLEVIDFDDGTHHSVSRSGDLCSNCHIINRLKVICDLLLGQTGLCLFHGGDNRVYSLASNVIKQLLSPLKLKHKPYCEDHEEGQRRCIVRALAEAIAISVTKKKV